MALNVFNILSFLTVQKLEILLRETVFGVIEFIGFWGL